MSKQKRVRLRLVIDGWAYFGSNTTSLRKLKAFCREGPFGHWSGCGMCWCPFKRRGGAAVTVEEVKRKARRSKK